MLGRVGIIEFWRFFVLGFVLHPGDLELANRGYLLELGLSDMLGPSFFSIVVVPTNYPTHTVLFYQLCAGTGASLSTRLVRTAFWVLYSCPYLL